MRAVRLDAAALLINLLDADDDPTVRQACLRNVFAAKAQCEHFGLPLMVEPIPFERRDGLYYDVADEERLVPLVRQAVEAGADIIKAGILADGGIDAAGDPGLRRRAVPRPRRVEG